MNVLALQGMLAGSGHVSFGLLLHGSLDDLLLELGLQEGVGLEVSLHPFGYPAPRASILFPDRELGLTYERPPVLVTTHSGPWAAIAFPTHSLPTSYHRAPVLTITKDAPSVVPEPSASPPSTRAVRAPVTSTKRRAPRVKIKK